MQKCYVFYLFSIFLILLPCSKQDYTHINKVKYEPSEIPEHKLSLVSEMGDINHMNQLLDNILIPRVVGTEGHTQVKKFIIKTMRNLKWHVETDPFEDKTPNMGTLTFENIIASLNPDADRFLILACHYDSKYFKDQEFLGATDSAVPCAMLINLAFVLDKYFKQIRNDNEISVKLLFFDGEEAFLYWNPQDSIYGARHLARKWESEGFLKKIDMLVLLDLLGTPDPNFFSFFENTQDWYSHLHHAEKRLAEMGYMERYSSSSVSARTPNSYFQLRSINSFVEDDHIPFLERGVPILHLIPSPFPTVWHQITDDRKAIDMFTVENLNKILRVFVIEYLHLVI